MTCRLSFLLSRSCSQYEGSPAIGSQRNGCDSQCFCCTVQNIKLIALNPVSLRTVSRSNGKIDSCGFCERRKKFTNCHGFLPHFQKIKTNGNRHQPAPDKEKYMPIGGTFMGREDSEADNLFIIFANYIITQSSLFGLFGFADSNNFLQSSVILASICRAQCCSVYNSMHPRTGTLFPDK